MLKIKILVLLLISINTYSQIYITGSYDILYTKSEKEGDYLVKYQDDYYEQDSFIIKENYISKRNIYSQNYYRIINCTIIDGSEYFYKVYDEQTHEITVIILSLKYRTISLFYKNSRWVNIYKIYTSW